MNKQSDILAVAAMLAAGVRPPKRVVYGSECPKCKAFAKILSTRGVWITNYRCPKCGHDWTTDSTPPDRKAQ